MYDIEQAKEVLRKKQFDDVNKRLNYYAHCKRVKEVKLLGLPYKVIKEQTDAANKKGEVPPNVFYPKHRTQINDFMEWLEQNHPDIAELHKDAATWFNFIIDKADNEKIISLEKHRSDAYRELCREHENSYKSFNNDTREGVEKRKYYMARFLHGYALDTFTMFDLLGVTNATREQVEGFRRELMELQADYEQNPQNYFTEIILLPKS